MHTRVAMNIDAQVERLDHLGVIAGVIKDLGLVEFIEPVDKFSRVTQAACSTRSKRFNINEIIPKYTQDSSVTENLS